MRRVQSSDGVQVAVHELGGRAGQPLVLIAHANGFHGRCYTEVARHLGDRFHCFGLDFRGHGETEAEPDWRVDWRAFGDDALAAGEHLAPDGGLIGVGHSMGGAALLMAAVRDPLLFSRLVLFEPITYPKADSEADPESLPIVQGARRRRRWFESFEDAEANYARKPPMSLMTPEVRRDYVRHGFRPVDGGVELSCQPETEVGIFLTARDNGVWDLLPHVAVPTLVVAGVIEDRQPAMWSEGVAERVQHGVFHHAAHMTHFGPFSHPEEFARIVAADIDDPVAR